MMESGQIDLSELNDTLPNIKGFTADGDNTRESGRSMDRYGNDYGFGTYIKKNI